MDTGGKKKKGKGGGAAVGVEDGLMKVEGEEDEGTQQDEEGSDEDDDVSALRVSTSHISFPSSPTFVMHLFSCQA